MQRGQKKICSATTGPLSAAQACKKFGPLRVYLHPRRVCDRISYRATVNARIAANPIRPSACHCGGRRPMVLGTKARPSRHGRRSGVLGAGHVRRRGKRMKDTAASSRSDATVTIESLLLEVARGSRRAFEDLYVRTSGTLLGVCLRVLPTRWRPKTSCRRSILQFGTKLHSSRRNRRGR
jgi:hypothetical protein